MVSGQPVTAESWVNFVGDRLALGQVSLPVLGFSRVTTVPLMLHFILSSPMLYDLSN
jgi:hypothetical protein